MTQTKLSRRALNPAPGTTGSDWSALRALLEIVIVVVCAGIALVPILPAYGSDQPLYAVIIGVVAGTLPVALGGYLRWPAGVTLLSATALYVLVGAQVAFQGQNVFGILPNQTALRGVLVGIVTSWKDSLTLEVPLGSSDGNLLLPFLVAYLGAGLATALVVWRRSWVTTIGATVVVMTTLIIAILWGPPVPTLSTTLGIGLAGALTLWSSWRMGLWRPKRWLSLCAVVIGTGLVAGTMVGAFPQDGERFVLRSVVIPPFDPSQQISPLSKYRAYIKDFEDVELLKITGIPQGGMVRIATMDEFDGVVWNVSNTGRPGTSAAFRRIGDAVSLSQREEAGQPYLLDVVVGDLTGVWVPTVGSLRTVLFDYSTTNRVDFRFNDLTKTAVVVAGITPGMRYHMTGTVVSSPSDLGLGDTEPGDGLINLDEVMAELVRDRSLQVSKDASTPALVARELETYLSENGYFSHGEQAGGAPSLSGHGTDRIASLLGAEIMVGDAEQYASAMALMAVAQGLPARVVMGFIPKDHDPNQAVTFTGADLTAWVEINYADFGWVPYFPTPDSSRTPQDVDKPQEADPQPQTNQKPPDPPPPVKPPQADTEEPNVKSQQVDPATESHWELLIKVAAGVGIPLVLLALWPAIILLRKWRRRQSRKKGSVVDQITGGWQELLDTSVDFGVQVGADQTRRQTARVISPGNTDLMRLAELADQAVFAPQAPDPQAGRKFWQLLGTTVDSLAKQRTKRARLRARLSRASLRRNRAQVKNPKR